MYAGMMKNNWNFHGQSSLFMDEVQSFFSIIEWKDCPLTHNLHIRDTIFVTHSSGEEVTANQLLLLQCFDFKVKMSSNLLYNGRNRSEQPIATSYTIRALSVIIRHSLKSTHVRTAGR